MNYQELLGLATIGIPPRDMVILKGIVRLSFSRTQSYDLVMAEQNPDIFLVDGDNLEAMRT